MSRMVDLAEKEIMRTEILEICQQSIPVGADERVIRAALRKCGHDVTAAEVEKALYYLQDKGLAELQTVENRRLGIRRTVARITGKGIDLLEGNGSAAGISMEAQDEQ